MEDKRPIVYVARAIRYHDVNYNNIPLIYFVSKARLQTEKTFHSKKGEKINSYEFSLHPYEFDLSQFKNIPSEVFVEIGEFVQSNFIAKDYKTCHQHVVNLNKKLLEKYPNTIDYIALAQQLEEVYITKEEMLGIEEEKEQE